MKPEIATHDQRFLRLEEIRAAWCQEHPALPKRETDNELMFDATGLQDIPDFYIRLGEVTNGSGGYYGGGLDALDDCLCGGFGIVPPFTLRISNSEQLEYCFRPETVELWISATKRHSTSPDELDPPQTDPPATMWDYLQDVFDIFKKHGVTVVLD